MNALHPLRDGKFLQKLGLSNEALFWLKVDGGDYTECWTWLGTRNYGYGQFNGEAGRSNRAHRYAYESLIGEIPEGLHLDHLCRNRACVNPWHLEPVTQAVNNVRAGAIHTHCSNGHEYTPENTYIRSAGTRTCRACNRDNVRAYLARRAATRKAVA